MKVIGVAGMARAGKDTFVKIAIELLRKNGYNATRVAFADKLKEEVENMLKQNRFSATSYTDDVQAKNLIRHLLVWWGCQRRYETDGGLYWVNEVDKQIRRLQEDLLRTGACEGKEIVLVSDVRFPNEVKWIQSNWDGSVIHLKRFSPNWVRGGQDNSDEFLVKEYDKAPNEEEAKQDPLVQELADVKTEWESKQKATAEDASSIPDLQKVVWDALNKTKFFKHSEPIIGKLNL